MEFVFAIGLVLLLLFFFNKKKTKNIPALQSEEIKAMEPILIEKVAFYNALSNDDKIKFKEKVIDFLNDVRITGIDVTVDYTDKILVAASAIIPIFGFNNWKYHNIGEVLLYPNSFNEKFETLGQSRNILGMVGEGGMNGTMILSKPALINSFLNETDKRNTGIHEFVHLIDKSDGEIDGIPESLLDKQYTIPWINLMSKEIAKINEQKSDIDSYGATSQAEFFAVASEYFFERPQLLQQKHPLLYDMLEQIFKQRMNKKKLV